MIRKHFVWAAILLSVTNVASAHERLSDSLSVADRVSFFDLSLSPMFSPFGAESHRHQGHRTEWNFLFLLEIKEQLKGNKKSIGDRETPTKQDLGPQTVVLETKPTELMDPIEVQESMQPDCLGLRILEPKAMLGRMTEEEVSCIESRISGSRQIVEKDRLSRVLMANAFASGDTRHLTLLRRHLDQIDRSDPDLAYKYAYALHKEGVSQAKEVVRWSQVALDGKSKWTGGTYQRRVYTTMKMRAVAAYQLWESAEKDYATQPTPTRARLKEKRRGIAKSYAREWLGFSVLAERETHGARALCRSVASTEAYCL